MSVGDSGPGSQAVYARIEGLTSCSDLQREFDIADANRRRQGAGTDQAEWSLGYMQAAERRLEQMSC